MGQKVNPIGLRLGINKTWSSKWYVDPRDYADTLHEDLKLRKALKELPETRNADIAEVEIVRHPQRITLVIHTSRPGVIIGTKGATIEKIGASLQKITGKKIQLKIKEIKKPETDAQIIALDVARKLKGRSSFRRTLKMTAAQAMKGGAQGVKILISGRLGGAEMSRNEVIKQGRIPLHTLRANINYGFAEAHTTFGIIGVKVWIFKGEVLKREAKEDAGALVRKKREPREGRK
ncbi:30S ribosomal protein S3 [Salinispira pacifica]|uniref:Small ribosomal subunit protein uS3 n=1 Tax=Salinispira pacifica TaxID=1307761 RepID=V5WEQ8_9SPIO|nr:30S ribosomal protein S3 [Salinispira pacifica]AHC14303.1 SSU ribosomal protein S3p (S3e) [Salinispira pacifica]